MPFRQPSASAVDRAVDALRAALFEGTIEPGAPLREVQLARSLGVGRSTVREALKILAQEGLARRTHNKGVVVTALAADDIDDIFRARRILEAAGVRAVKHAPREAIEELHTALARYANAARRGDDQAALAAHLGFHCAIVGLLGSGRLLSTAESLVADVRLAMAVAARKNNNALEQVNDHARLLKLIESAQIDDAVIELTRHLARGRTALSARRTHHATS